MTSWIFASSGRTRWMNWSAETLRSGARLQLHEHAHEIFRGNDRPGAGEGDDALDRRILQQGVGHLGLPVDHGGEGNVLAALDRDEDEAGVLLGKQALGDRHVQPAGEDGQGHGRRQGERLVIEHPDEAAIVAALHRIEGVLAGLVDAAALSFARLGDAGSART